MATLDINCSYHLTIARNPVLYVYVCAHVCIYVCMYEWCVPFFLTPDPLPKKPEETMLRENKKRTLLRERANKRLIALIVSQVTKKVRAANFSGCLDVRG